MCKNALNDEGSPYLWNGGYNVGQVNLLNHSLKHYLHCSLMICIRITVHSGQVGQIFACHLIS